MWWGPDQSQHTLLFQGRAGCNFKTAQSVLSTAEWWLPERLQPAQRLLLAGEWPGDKAQSRQAGPHISGSLSLDLDSLEQSQSPPSTHSMHSSFLEPQNAKMAKHWSERSKNKISQKASVHQEREQPPPSFLNYINATIRAATPHQADAVPGAQHPSGESWGPRLHACTFSVEALQLPKHWVTARCLDRI